MSKLLENLKIAADHLAIYDDAFIQVKENGEIEALHPVYVEINYNELKKGNKVYIVHDKINYNSEPFNLNEDEVVHFRARKDV